MSPSNLRLPVLLLIAPVLLVLLQVNLALARLNWIQRDTSETVAHSALQQLEIPLQAREVFHLQMRPHMREMKKVRKHLAAIRDEMMLRKSEQMVPSALLAHALHLERMRAELDGDADADAETISEGVEGIRMINSGIADYMYQGDMLMDARQTSDMMDEMQRMREDDFRPSFPPKFRWRARECR